jgi:hypothetical protein
MVVSYSRSVRAQLPPEWVRSGRPRKLDVRSPASSTRGGARMISRVRGATASVRVCGMHFAGAIGRASSQARRVSFRRTEPEVRAGWRELH